MSPVKSDRRLRILLIDDHIPYPELGVGYPRARNLLHALHAMGHAIVLAPADTAAETPQALRRVVPAGVTVELGVTPERLPGFLARQAGRFDLLLVSRPANLRRVLSARPDAWRHVPILYDAEAVWAVRTALQQQVNGTPLPAPDAERLLQDEVDLARSAAHVVAVNDAEAALFRQRGCASVSVLAHGFTTRPTPKAWDQRRDILFVGALDDEPSPNVDALTWFVREVMPRLQAQRTQPLKLRVAGRCAAPSVHALAGPQVDLLGQLPDLQALYDDARLFVAPHRYAAGIPTKVLEAAAHGLPCVCSSLLAGQLNWSHGQQVLTADTAAAFADAVTRLDTDPALWNDIRSGALYAVQQQFTPARFDADLARALDEAMRLAPPGRSLGARIAGGWQRGTRILRRQLQNRVDAWRIARSPHFDSTWYLRLYPDVAAAGADPAMHYLLHGAAEGRDPGPGFSTMGYLRRHAAAAAAGRNPLLHCVDAGAAQADVASPPMQAAPRPTHVVLICGEPGTAGVELRITHLAVALAARGAITQALTIPEALARGRQLGAASLLVLWRTAWDDSVAQIVRLARQGGATVMFDADDLVIEPGLARVDVIDGIRTQQLTEDEVRRYFERTLRAFEAADWACASTESLAAHMRVRGKPTFVLPNGFSDAGHARARQALLRRQSLPDDGFVRIGYAAGTRTHQRDFAIAAQAVADVLRQRSQCRLVLFRRADGEPLLDIDEFACLQGLQAQIEWRSFVPMDRLADELVRFDINIAPVETGNPFCESKSELKYVDAALVGVCTVASPTEPFARAIDAGRTGFLADDAHAWRATLLQLVDDPVLRRRVAAEAYRQVLWRQGPRRRAELAGAMLDQMLAPPRLAARAAAWQAATAGARHAPAMALPEAEVVLAADRPGVAQVTVVVPLHNYAGYVTEALDSVAAQTLQDLDLIVVDDASTDASLAIAGDWMRRHAGRFHRVRLLRHAVNAGLGPTRNSAIERAETRFVLPLDADDRLLPAACEKLLAALQSTQADFAYPLVQQFGEGSEIMGRAPYSAQSLVAGNCIAAIALIRKESWAAVGGYAGIDQGWEDFDFWCKFVELGLWGHQLPEVLAEYRIHAASMTRRTTELAHNKKALVAVMRARHPWLSLPSTFGVTVPGSDVHVA